MKGANAAPGPESWAGLLDEFPFAEVFRGHGPVDFTWQAGRSAFLGPEAGATLDALTGRFPALRDWHTLRHGVGKVRDLLRVRRACLVRTLRLPPDAVVLLKAGGKVAVVLSLSGDMALKVERHLFAEHSQRCAVAGDECFLRAGLSPHAPALVSYGKAADGMFHTAWRFVPNRLPLFHTWARANWPGTLQRHLLPILQRLYQANGLELLDGPEWVRSIEGKLAGRTLPAPLCGFWKKTLDSLRCLDAVTPVAMVSGDLQPQNIHYHDGRIVILDWSNDKTAAVALDFFCDLLYPAVREPGGCEARDFWDIIAGCGDSAGATGRTARMCALWRDWLERWLGVRVTSQILSLQLRGMCLDWLVTMNHLWSPAGTLWRNPFPERLLRHESTAP